MDAVLYTRKSRLEDGTSTRDQEREGRARCEREGWPVDQVFCDEGISASRYGKKRDAWTALKEHLRPGHILVVEEASRTARDLEEFVALRNLCAQLQVPLAYAGRILDFTSGDDRFVGGLDALIAERESEQIRTRTLRGKRASAADGKPAGRPPWGYTATAPGVWEPDPVEAPRVREAVERMIEGESQYSILRWLQATGKAPANPTSLKRALSNPALAAKRVHQGEVIGDAVWLAIITEAQHHQVVARGRRDYTPPGPEPQHLLSGIATCGKCGKGLRHRNFPGKKDMYICRQGHVGRTVKMLEQEVVKALFRRLKNISPEDYDSSDQRVAEALAEIERIEQKLGEWEEKAINDEVTPAAFAKIEKGLRQRIAELQPRTLNGKRMFRPENWDDYTLRERRAAIRAHLTITVPPLGTPKRRVVPSEVAIIKPI